MLLKEIALAGSLVVGALLVAGPAIAGKPTSKSVPYKDKVVGTITGQDANVLSFTAVGTGAHLGRFTTAGELVLGTPVDGVTPFTGTNTLTAANGDQLFIDIVDGALGAPGADGTATIELSTAFTGGTGRFVDATGGFDGAGRFDFGTYTFAGDGLGTLTTPK